MKTLIIVDMQNDFLTGPLGNDHCRKAIPEVVKLIKDENYNSIFVTRDTHFSDYNRTLEGTLLPVPHCLLRSEGWNVEKTITEALIEKQKTTLVKVVNKPTFGSYKLIYDIAAEAENFVSNDRIGNNTDECMKERIGAGGSLQFHVCGVCTSICVLANVVLLRAKYPDAEIIVHANACGDVTPEAHAAAIACFKAQQCKVVGE